MPYIDELEDYLKSNFKFTNLYQNRSKYIDPRVSVGYDTETKYAGYAPNNNLDHIVLNPERQRDQYGSLGTYAHEMAHTAQPFSLRTLGGVGGLPGWQMQDVNFPYYDETPFPHVVEKLARLREGEAMARAGSRWWETVAGEDTLEQLKQKNQYGRQRAGYSEDQIKEQVDALLYPKDRQYTYIKKSQGK